MLSSSSNNKRIAKNTLYLYFRLLLHMGISLYTSRIVLSILGIEDFGIYNVVGGIIILFTFINNSMVLSTQRFLNYEIGRNNYILVQQVFSTSFYIHLCLALFVLIIGETIGLWLLDNFIQYPINREKAVYTIYHLTILTTCFNIIRAPYNASIIAYEKMSFYAYISIVEVSLRLVIVYILLFFDLDRLILYAILILIVTLCINFCYYNYCKKYFSTVSIVFYWDKQLFYKMFSFSGWNLFGSFANVAVSQGQSILLNMFFGVTLNAAMGIVTHVQSAIFSFASNFQTAFHPQIIKSYAIGDHDYFVNLIFMTSKYSYFLLFVISLPLYICCSEVMSLWLVEVPVYTVELTRLIIIFSLLDALQIPFWISVQATGRIRNYQIGVSLFIILSLPISYLALHMGFSPLIVLQIRCTMNFLLLYVRLLFMKGLFDFSIIKYVNKVLRRVVWVTMIAMLTAFIPFNISNPIIKVLVVVLLTFLFNVVLIYKIGLENKERFILRSWIICKYKKYNG